MRKDIYNTFDNIDIPYNFPASFHDDKFDYLEGDKPTYEIEYGDTIILPFQLNNCCIDRYINIIVYNYRHEEIYCDSQMPDEYNRVYLNITDDISTKLFKKGYYYIQLQAERMVNLMVVVETLINADDCTLYVR